MSGLIVACVRTGVAYPFDYVVKLRNMVARHMPREYELVCLTDQPDRCADVTFIAIKEVGLHGWSAKMILFEQSWRGHAKVIYCDLDSVLIGNLAPLADVPGELAICESFTRLAGNKAYPCKFNSSVMVIGPGMAGFVWDAFERRRNDLLERHARYGDQACIEQLAPDAAFLQRLVPKDFFFNYRHLTMHKPKHSAIVNFGGARKPHNCPIPWVAEEWV